MIPVGVPLALLSDQEFWRTPAILYRNTRLLVESLTTQRNIPSVTRSRGFRFEVLSKKLFVAFWLPETRDAAFA